LCLARLGPQLQLWLGLVADHPFTFHYSSRHIKKRKTTPDCPGTMLRGPGTTPLSRVRFSAALSPATAPASTASIHRGPPASQPRTQRYIIARDRPETSSLHSRPSLRCSKRRWGKPKSRHQN